MQVVPQLLAGQPEWVVLVVALGVGIAGALLAVLLQWLAAGAAGFMLGGLAVLGLQRSAGMQESWLLIVLGAVVGAALVMALLDWALIFLSSLGWALLLLQPWALAPMLLVPAWLVLMIAGIAFQGARLFRSRQREAF